MRIVPIYGSAREAHLNMRMIPIEQVEEAATHATSLVCCEIDPE